MKYEIEIPAGVIPKGYEPVAFRKPMDAEECVSSTGGVFTSSGDLGEPRLILRRKWQWPEWLNADRLEWDRDWVAHKQGIRWSIYWEMIASDPPHDKTRVYHNPRKAGGK